MPWCQECNAYNDQSDMLKDYFYEIKSDIDLLLEKIDEIIVSEQKSARKIKQIKQLISDHNNNHESIIETAIRNLE